VPQATCSLDGGVRVYEAVDLSNLSNWQLQEEFEADKKDCSCISWNPSPFDNPMMVVGSSSAAKVRCIQFICLGASDVPPL